MVGPDGITLEATQEILHERRIHGLAEALWTAVQEWRIEHHGPGLQEATRAALINDLFYWNLQNLSIAADAGMNITTVSNQRLVVFDERVVVRCKHVNRDLASRNYPTTQAQRFVQQKQIDGFPELDRLHIAYRLDTIGLSLRDAFVARPVGRRHRFNDWVWQFWGESIASTSLYNLQQPLPTAAFAGQRFHHEDYSPRFA